MSAFSLPPASFSASDFAKQQRQLARLRETTVLCLHQRQHFLVAGTTCGLIAVFTPFSSLATPLLRFDTGCSAIYDLASHGDLLIAATDIGVVAYAWPTILEAVAAPEVEPSAAPEPAFEFCIPPPALRKVARPIAEANGLAVDAVADAVWVAGGDGDAYCLDLSTGKGKKRLIFGG